MSSGTRESKEKEIYVEPQVIATYGKEELEDNITTRGQQNNEFITVPD